MAAIDDPPHHPVRAGGGSDIVGRILAQRMQEKLGQSVVVENRPGAGGVIGNEAVARAAKDGYTLGVMTAGQTIAAVLRKSMPYDQLTAFDSIGTDRRRRLRHRDAIGLSRRQREGSDRRRESPSRQADRRGARLRRHPAHGRRAVQPDRGHQCRERTVPHHTRSGRRIDGQAGGHFVRYRAGRAGQIQSGQLKAIAVTGKDRSPAVPKVPSVVESRRRARLRRCDLVRILGPRGIPPAVIAKLNKTVNESLAEPAVQERMIKAGVSVHSSTPEVFAKHLADEFARWSKVRDAAGMAQQ